MGQKFLTFYGGLCALVAMHFVGLSNFQVNPIMAFVRLVMWSGGIFFIGPGVLADLVMGGHNKNYALIFGVSAVYWAILFYQRIKRSGPVHQPGGGIVTVVRRRVFSSREDE